MKANVIDIKTGIKQLTNDFRFTWCHENKESVQRTVMPTTYDGMCMVSLSEYCSHKHLESMWWIEGKRALELGAKIRGIRQSNIV